MHRVHAAVAAALVVAVIVSVVTIIIVIVIAAAGAAPQLVCFSMSSSLFAAHCIFVLAAHVSSVRHGASPVCICIIMRVLLKLQLQRKSHSNSMQHGKMQHATWLHCAAKRTNNHTASVPATATATARRCFIYFGHFDMNSKITRITTPGQTDSGLSGRVSH